MKNFTKLIAFHYLIFLDYTDLAKDPHSNNPRRLRTAYTNTQLLELEKVIFHTQIHNS